MKDRGIQFNEVSMSFGATLALDRVSFDITEGENTVLLGPSGCGKSTALRLLAGLEVPTSGQIRSGDTVLSTTSGLAVPPHQRNLAMVFQDLALWPAQTVLENVVLGLSGLRLNASDARRRARETLDLCGIASLVARKPHQLSGGQQQRVALARALAVAPRFLLLDEPFTGLDLITKQALLTEIRNLGQRKQTTLVLVTHDPMEAVSLCSRVVLLSEGKVAESGDLPTMLREGRSPLLDAFRAQSNLFSQN